MRTLALALVLIACKSEKPAPAPAPASGTAVVVAADAASPALPALCTLGVAAIDGAQCPTPELLAGLRKAKKSLDGVVQTAGVAAANAQQVSVLCAQIVFALDRDAKKAGCTLALGDDKRAEITAALDAWYARRTEVTPVGDAEADAVIAKMVALRDETCACKTGKCLDALTPKLGAVGTMPATAPQAARDLGTKVLEDVARCAQRIRTLDDPA